MEFRPHGYRIAAGEPTRPAPEHPDPAVAARLATVARRVRPRRFALCQAIPAGPDVDDLVVRPQYQGLQNPDGSCVLLIAGQPYGWYRSIDAAYAHAEGTDLWLVWLDPEPGPPEAESAAALDEARDGDVGTWLVGLPFLAHGPNDARIRAIEMAHHLEPATPGLSRRSALLFTGDDPLNPITLYCPTAPCARRPFHDGEHLPPSPQ
ncbi:hypothetical protein LX16_4230 [Stackebrandtia albiflava]|uniref:Uncharacterized protein n=1 Tax=Stackebrandtia albiflava TaxID=406432 RepID=A0A562UYW8_9ACTN|nr:hypothetical protein [Stackebrandtia albiflava]TWJ10806.1 hypothetical protein LX16_4230 [Stackebrandtia albiflava]